MYYEKIDGWFNYQNFYQWVLSKSNQGVFVEIGLWKGKSITFMAEKVKEMNYKLKLIGIDTFEGTTDVPSLMADPNIQNGTLLDTYFKNIGPVKEYITTIVGDSHAEYIEFENESIDVLFIDGDHSYAAVKADIELWFPKVKMGGIISGHDFGTHAPGVIQAVKELLPGYKLFDEQSSVWYLKKVK
jgi:hypothetical protein